MGRGTVLRGEYVLADEIDRGGMGRVWRASRCSGGRDVAVKTLLSDTVSEGDRKRFLRECRLLEQLCHPGLPEVFDSGEHDGELFLVMELLHGSDLGKVLGKRPKGLPYEEALRLTIEAAEALAAAHAEDIIHRDLKPGNLFLCDGGQLKVCDFGLARNLDDTRITPDSYGFMGTPHYAAPEQWGGGRPLTTSLDLYSLGCVLYALITGSPPFDARWHQQLMLKHLNDVPVGLRQRRPEIPPRLDALGLALLAKDPADRPESAAWAAAELRAILADGPAAEAPAAPADPTRRDRRPWLAPVLGLAAASVAVLLLAVTCAGPGRPGPAPSPSPIVTLAATPPVAVTDGGPLSDLHSPVTSLDFSADGATLAAGGENSTVVTWDMRRRAMSGAPLAAPKGKILSVAFSNVANVLAASGEDHMIRLWDIATRRRIGRPLVTGSYVDAIAFDPADGLTLVSGDRKDIVNVWDTSESDPAPQRLWQAPRRSGVAALSFSSTGTLAVGEGTGRLSLWDVARAHCIAGADIHAQISTVALSPDGAYLAVGLRGGALRFWSTDPFRPLGQPVQDGGGWVNAMAFVPGRPDVLATGDSTGDLRFWDVTTGQEIGAPILDANAGDIYALAFDPASAAHPRLATGRRDGTVRIWSVDLP